MTQQIEGMMIEKKRPFDRAEWSWSDGPAGDFTATPPDWMSQGACGGDNALVMDVVYGYDPRSAAEGRVIEEARAVCASCSVRETCLEFEMEHERGLQLMSRYGMFGGLMPAERLALDATVTVA